MNSGRCDGVRRPERPWLHLMLWGSQTAADDMLHSSSVVLLLGFDGHNGSGVRKISLMLFLLFGVGANQSGSASASGFWTARLVPGVPGPPVVLLLLDQTRSSLSSSCLTAEILSFRPNRPFQVMPGRLTRSLLSLLYPFIPHGQVQQRLPANSGI